MGRRILFYAKRNLHLPHMEPVRQWLAENAPEAEIRVSSPPYSPPRESLPGEGLTSGQIQELESSGIVWMPEADIPKWSPEATVLADADLGGIFWGGKLINVNHGLISKGTFYTNAPNVLRENALDLICVPGKHHAEVLSRVLKPPVIATGFVKFDPIGRGELTRVSARKSFGIPEDREVVTFAPTFNLELSAVPVLADRVRELIANHPNRHLLIKLHGMAPSIWVEMYRLIAMIVERIHFVESVDLTPALIAADVIISDVSSAFMEAIALDKPVVLVDNPLQTSFAHYDPNDIEYAWRHVGLQTSTVEETLAAVERSFENPGEKAELRAMYGPRLVGPIDGKAAERAAREVLHATGMPLPRRESKSQEVLP
ncbi:MAG: CDP-glycerol glycerophosphotransferase family protein [bacterium]